MDGGWSDIWRLLMPPVDDRNPIAFGNISILFLPHLLLAIHGSMSLHSAPRIAHMSLLPMTILVSVYTHGSYVFTYPRANVYNQVLGVVGCWVVLRAIDWSFVPVRRREGRPDPKTPLEEVVALVDLMFDIRGIHHTYGEHCRFQPVRDPRVGPFLKSRGVSFLMHFLAVDVLKTGVRVVGPIGSSAGASIYMDSFDPPWRYVMSTLLTLCIGAAICTYIQALHDLASIIAVLVFRNEPTSWPTMFYRPWAAESVADFWADRWHQLFRRSFVLCSWPGRWLAGDVGAIIFAFLGSGVMHEVGFRCMDQGGTGWGSIGFFLLQGVACIVEGMILRLTGVRVVGPIGWLWTYLWIVGTGHMIADAWAVRGTAGVILYPDSLSVVDTIQRWVFPDSPYAMGH